MDVCCLCSQHVLAVIPLIGDVYMQWLVPFLGLLGAVAACACLRSPQWHWRWLMTAPGTCKGVSGSSRLLLESMRAAAAAACHLSWSLQYLFLKTSNPIHNWVLFFLWLHPFILSGVISPWSPVAYWAPTDLGSSSFSILSFCLFILFSRQECWSVCHSLLQWTTFCQTSPPWPTHLGWPHKAWLSFIELDKTVVCVIRLTSFCDVLWFVCLPSDASCNTYHLSLVSLIITKPEIDDSFSDSKSITLFYYASLIRFKP